MVSVIIVSVIRPDRYLDLRWVEILEKVMKFTYSVVDYSLTLYQQGYKITENSPSHGVRTVMTVIEFDAGDGIQSVLTRFGEGGT